MKLFGKISKNDISMVIGLVMAAIVFLAAIFAPYLAPYDPLEINVMERLEPMSRLHPLGTDAWGRDMLSRIIFGARYSLVIGVVSVGIRRRQEGGEDGCQKYLWKGLAGDSF